MTRPVCLIPFEAYDTEIQKLLTLLRTLGLDIPEDSLILSDENAAFRFLYYSLFADERPASVDDALARRQAGLGDLATKINKAWRPSAGLARTLSKTVITTFGRDFAMASTLFHRTNAPGKVGRMTQTWVRFEKGWRIVVGHVSIIEEPAS